MGREIGQNSAQTPLDKEFDTAAKILLEEWHVPGIAIAVIDGDQTFAKGYGNATVASEPVTPETLFFTASTTKAFTSAAISLLIDDDGAAKSQLTPDSSSTPQAEPLTWKSRISSIIPDYFVLPDAQATANVTIEDALCHRTGMPDHENSFGPKTTDVRAMVCNLRHLPMNAGLHGKYIYNNIMYTTISYVIETRTGQGMGEFLKERIWKPLGMGSTYWTLSDVLTAEQKGQVKLARGYAWDAITETYVQEELPDFPGVSGSGAIISNVLDYAKWLRCMLARSLPLSPVAHSVITTPRIVVPNPSNDPFPGSNLYALGWFHDTYRGEPIIWHTGGWTGFGALMCFLPKKNWGVVMLGNTSRTSNYVQLVLWFRLLDQLLETPEAEQLDLNTRFKGIVSARREANEKARERLYPQYPTMTVQMAMALEAYAGIYRHPGYGKMQFVVEGQGLVADRREMEIAMDVRLEHVYGELWLAYLEVKNRDKREVEVVRAEFHVDADGKVGKFGIELESKMGGEKIWFLRIDA